MTPTPSPAPPAEIAEQPEPARDPIATGVFIGCIVGLLLVAIFSKWM